MKPNDKAYEAAVEAIESDKDDPTREYIPLPGGWEIQTKGRGSSYRLLDTKTGERHMILAGDAPFVQEFVTRMAKEINAIAQVRPVAPVDDEALVEVAARAICLNRASHVCNCKKDGVCKAPLENLREYNEVWPQSSASIAATRPHIEATEREKIKAAFEGTPLPLWVEQYEDQQPYRAATEYAEAIYAAIRRGK